MRKILCNGNTKNVHLALMPKNKFILITQRKTPKSNNFIFVMKFNSLKLFFKLFAQKYQT